MRTYIQLNKKNGLLFLLITFCQQSFTQPVINSFFPTSGPVGTSITITGSNFSPIPSNNIVYFGGTQAIITVATTASIVATVPAGTTYQPITVTTNYLTAYSKQPFIVTFSNNGLFTTSSFAPKIDVSTSPAPINNFLGDLNQDGFLDIATANNTSTTMSVFKNNTANGIIAFNTEQAYVAGASPQTVCMGDLDGDGKLDIVAAGSYNSISIYRNNTTSGTITFDAKIDYPTGTSPVGIAIQDLDGDGKPDIIVANYNSYTISVFKNLSTPGNVSFAPKVDYSTGTVLPRSVVIGDLDGDGMPDIAVACYNSTRDSLQVFRNLSTVGNISFASRINFKTARGGSWNLAIGDLDGDGKLDIAIVAYVFNKLSIIRNTSTPGIISFDPDVDYITGRYPESIAIGDVNGDGKPDIVTGNYLDNTVSVLKNTCSTGSISFASKVDYPTGTNPKSISTGDIDRDGKPDLCITNLNSNTFSILRNLLVLQIRICPNSDTTVRSNLTGVSYQWQLSIDSVTFNNLNNNNNYTGTNSVTLGLHNLSSSTNGYQYRCVVDGNNSNNYSIEILNYWSGSAGIAWENPANWSCGVIPDGYTDVIIDGSLANSPTISTTVSCHKLSLVNGGTITIATGGNLIITGN